MTVAVGLSGGVDSTVTAWLLQQHGHEVIGITMQLWEGEATGPPPGQGAGCHGPAGARAVKAARAIAARLGIAHHLIPLGGDFARCVLDPFRATYRAGRTPNPCVLCNEQVKFGAMPARARELGIAFDRLATGHYVRLEFDAGAGIHRLRTGLDPAKDQSYFLSRLRQAQLGGLCFPLGDRIKTDVRELAIKAGFADVAAGRESQDFATGEGAGYGGLFSEAESPPGPLLDTTGRRLGTHRGLVHYTVGQRQGLGVATGSRLYVKSLHPETNTVLLAPRDELFSDACLIEQANWLAGRPPPDGHPCTVRLRYRHPGVSATLHRLADCTWRANFAAPQFAVAPGQAAVCYTDDELLGGGWIGSVPNVQ